MGVCTAVPLAPVHVDRDLEAVLASAERLQRWSRSSWPEESFGRADNLVDLERHDDEHRRAVACTYSLQDDAGAVQGCLYLLPVALACATRDLATPGLIPATDGIPGAGDLVARGWLRAPFPERPLVPAVFGWLTVAFAPARWWWQFPEDLSDQDQGCEDAGLTTTWRCSDWRFRAAPAPETLTLPA